MEDLLGGLAQVGAVGAVAAVLLWQSFRTQERMSAAIERMQEQLAELVRNNTQAFQQLSDRLGSRPCLLSEKRGSAAS